MTENLWTRAFPGTEQHFKASLLEQKQKKAFLRVDYGQETQKPGPFRSALSSKRFSSRVLKRGARRSRHLPSDLRWPPPTSKGGARRGSGPQARDRRARFRETSGKVITLCPLCVFSDADDSEEENLESDLGQVGNHAFARMEGDVDKQRKQILQGQMSEATAQKQHQRKYPSLLSAFLHRTV